MTQLVQEKKPPYFDWLSEYCHVERMLTEGRRDRVSSYVGEAAKKYSHSRYLHILLGSICYCMNAPVEAVRSFEAAAGMTTEEGLPETDSPATRAYVESQLRLPTEQRPVTKRGRAYFAKNLSALRTVDADLADELENCPDGNQFELLDLWGRIHLFSPQTGRVATLVKGFPEQVRRCLTDYLPAALTAILSGQELPYCLEHAEPLPLGRKRTFYLFEKDPQMLRWQLHVTDMSASLQSEEAVILGGRNAEKRIDQFFGTFCHAPPMIIVGDDGPIQDRLQRIYAILQPAEYRDPAEAYYASGEFAERLRAIAAGQIPPRVLGYTCRWTTFLKYCAQDFLTAFGRLECPTQMLIEEGDTETLTLKRTFQVLNEFRPDVVLSVSHARPSFMVPKQLPVIGYIQDKCGPILTENSLSGRIEPRDLVVCAAKVFQDYLIGKGVPPELTWIMPVPADETMFYPLPADMAGVDRFRVDVGFVKHADSQGDKAFDNFVRMHIQDIKAPEAKNALLGVFTELYRATCPKDGRRCYEDQMQDFVRSRLRFDADGSGQERVRQMVSSFFIMVFANTWRYQFLDTLDEAGIELGLFGNHWEQHPRYKHLGRGPVDRATELNKVYNFNRINLNIHPTATIHQRVCECALAGGFMIGTDHAEDKDWGTVRPYFEPGREIVLFDTAQDLVDKCRYYLAHPQERLDIARRFHERAVREQTVVVGARKILAQWRQVLKRALA